MNIQFMTAEEIAAILPLGDQLEDYINNGFKYVHGSFLNAIIEGDLVGACSRADHVNFNLIGAYGVYMYRAPMGCRGNADVQRKWKGLNFYKS